MLFDLVHSFCSTFVFTFLASTLVVASLGAHGASSLSRRHTFDFNITHRDTHLEKRFSGARFTYYYVGLNACGSHDKDADFVVAINAPQYSNGAHCYQDITIKYHGKTAHAKITDLCPTCPYGALDLSPSLFKYIIPGGFDAGSVFDGTWSYGVSGDEEEKPKTTKSEIKAKVTTSAMHKTTSTPPPKPKPTSTKEMKTTTTTSTMKTSSKSKSTTSTTSAAPQATQTAWDSGNIEQFNLSLLQLSDLSDTILTSQKDD